MKDEYASEAETAALIQPDTRTPAQKQLDKMLADRGADEQSANVVLILYEIALELLAKQQDPDVIGVYKGREGRRDWWSGGCWLRPNEAVAIITVEAEQ